MPYNPLHYSSCHLILLLFLIRISVCQLQNLQYQKIHLNKELHLCLNYHGHDGIELVSDADFEANTTEEQRKGPKGSHAYELARLTFEMKKREELVSSLKTLELRRKLYEGKLAMQRKFLDSLQVRKSG